MVSAALFSSLLMSTTTHSHPTSKEYVDSQINQLAVIINGLQSQVNQQAQYNQAGDAKLNQQILNLSQQFTTYNQTVDARFKQLEHEIGESYQGGIVFYVDESKQHGLVVAKMDANRGGALPWQNGESGDKAINARANGVLAGDANTNLIIAEETIDDQEGQFAALISRSFSVQDDGLSPCDESNLSCFGRWYLPSAYELKLLKENLYAKGLGDLSGIYWSSTEQSVSEAWQLDFNQGDLEVRDKMSLAKVRPIHAF